ncbi:MAG TPA: L,D-transpeptidase family protein [Bacteroidia bacterium]|nr:L,D-transpeptidase family protein [Bacteroidia bacterium]
MLKSFVCFMLLSFCTVGQSAFLKQQLKYPHVAQAYKEKWSAISKNFKEKGIDSNDFNVLIRVFKEEKTVELWLKAKNVAKYIYYTSYSICRSSGVLGPKRTEGDLQVPEGFYKVNFFNAYSDYYLAMQVDYPNQSDKILGRKPFGGEIMIHGNCVTIGCIPITDDKIKELYLICLYSKGAGHDVIVHSFPFKLEAKKLEEAKKQYNKPLTDFWSNLAAGYNYFEEKKQLPQITVEANGAYKIR